MAGSRRNRGCRMYVAAAGYGKTTAAEASLTGPVARFAATEFTGVPAATQHVIIDGVEELTAVTVRRLAVALADVSDQVLVSLCSRRLVPPRVRAACRARSPSRRRPSWPSAPRRWRACCARNTASSRPIWPTWSTN